MPLIADVQAFQEQWVIWWGSCQPKWRSTGTWPYSRDDCEGKDWARLNVTGPSGLFAVVMSTSWWVSAMGPDSHHEVFNAAVEDLHWVIGCLIHFNSRLQVTEPQCNAALPVNFPGQGERGPGKRKVKPTPKVANK
jgi:hypothetical protein